MEAGNGWCGVEAGDGWVGPEAGDGDNSVVDSTDPFLSILYDGANLSVFEATFCCFSLLYVIA